MLALSYKSKQYLLLALKVFILGLTFWYIYAKLSDANSQTISVFLDRLHIDNAWLLMLFVGLAITNWYFEILKWQTVVNPIKRITFSEAMKQSLTALTASLATPNRIGDYGAKALFYPSAKRKKILLLNFYGNATQLFVTLVFGVIGLIFILIKFNLSFSWVNILLFIGCLLLAMVIGFLFKEKELLIKGFTIKKAYSYISNLPLKIKLTTFIYSLIRYLCFSFLFLELLGFFEADLAVTQAYPLIFAMYLLVSIIPTIFIFDVIVRGGIAVWLFSLAGVPELTVLCTVLAMWILNFVLPAIAGGYYLLTYKNSEL